MPRRLLVNDVLSALPDHRTFWNDLQEWFGMEFTYPAGRNFSTLADDIDVWVDQCKDGNDPYSLIVRNCSYFRPLNASEKIPTISLLQDIFTEGPAREMQESVIDASSRIVFNSEFTKHCYDGVAGCSDALRPQPSCPVIPLPVDFRIFEPGNSMGLQQALSLPDSCVCWVGASQGAAGVVKGYDIFLQIVRTNPDIPFVAVFKDQAPEYPPPNMRCYTRLAQEDLASVIGACRVGLCTSRQESQHLAGIEMGACGLPLVVPNTGIYWNQGKDWASRVECPGLVLEGESPLAYSNAIRAALNELWQSSSIRDYWKERFDREVIRKQWAALIAEVECSGVS